LKNKSAVILPFTEYEEIRKISRKDDVESFDSGRDSSNTWLRMFAKGASKSGDAQVYVFCKGDKIVGYYTLTAAVCEASEVSIRVGKGIPKKGSVSAILIGQLAVDKIEQGKKIGSFLLRDALKKTVELSEIVGVRIALVQAIDEDTKRFYSHFNFEESPVSNLTMMLLVKDIREGFKVH
jgi:predicted N-acetyltransferase YhbS